jgi:galactoside O-acetyltransferase
MRFFQELAAFCRRNGIKAIGVHIVEIYIGAILRALPGVEGLFLRSIFYKLIFKSCKGGLIIYPSVYIIFSHRISVGERVAINVNSYLDGRGEITIGNGVLVGPNCVIASCEHTFDNRDVPIYQQPVKYGPVIIEDDVWIGANVVIKCNVIVGKGSVVGAGAVVTKNVEPYTIVAGVPAKKIGVREPSA